MSEILLERLLRFKGYQPTIEKTIRIDGISYPVTIQGKGKINVVCIGGATLVQRALSSECKEFMTLYAADLYWPKKFKLANPAAITIDKIVDDMISVIDQLQLDDIILFGHSAYGLMAMEAAKRCDPRIKGVIMVGTPTESNSTIAEANNKYFEEHASQERKENDGLRKEYYQKIRKPTDSAISLNAYESFSARYWYDYNISRKFLEELWQDVEIDDNICNHFFGDLLPKYITKIDIEKIKIPVILLAGQYDYDCAPLNLWQTYPKPKDFTIIDCANTGHWPMIENYEEFDHNLVNWLKQIRNIKYV